MEREEQAGGRQEKEVGKSMGGRAGARDAMGNTKRG